MRHLSVPISATTAGMAVGWVRMFRISSVINTCIAICALVHVFPIAFGDEKAKAAEAVLYAFQGGSDGENLVRQSHHRQFRQFLWYHFVWRAKGSPLQKGVVAPFSGFPRMGRKTVLTPSKVEAKEQVRWRPGYGWFWQSIRHDAMGRVRLRASRVRHSLQTCGGWRGKHALCFPGWKRWGKGLKAI